MDLGCQVNLVKQHHQWWKIIGQPHFGTVLRLLKSGNNIFVNQAVRERKRWDVSPEEAAAVDLRPEEAAADEGDEGHQHLRSAACRFAESRQGLFYALADAE